MVNKNTVNEMIDIIANRKVIEDLLEYIKHYLEIDEVFDEDEIHEFVKNKYTISELFDIHTILEEVENLDPDDVFSDNVLSTWAENNGYVIPNDPYDYYEDR
jgi:energy-converting hydrogenase A subunit M